MSTPISPLIPTTLSVRTLQADTVKMKSAIMGSTVMNNGFVSTAGPASVIIDGDNQTYPVANVCAGMIVRTGTTGASNDILPSATAMAEELGLRPVEGISYIRTMAIYNDNNDVLVLSGTGWTMYGNTISSYFSNTMSYALSYTAEDGWEILFMMTGRIDLD
jgi:hypothetical protein